MSVCEGEEGEETIPEGGERTGGGKGRPAVEEGARGQPLALLPLSPGWLEGDEPKSALIRSEGRSVAMRLANGSSTGGCLALRIQLYRSPSPSKARRPSSSLTSRGRHSGAARRSCMYV